MKKPKLNKMKEVNNIIARLFIEMEDMIKQGVTTKKLDDWAEDFINRNGAKPAFKGYRGFPATLCVSINKEIIHGIPSKRKILKNGDLVSIDVGAIKDGHFADAARTFLVGNVSLEHRRLTDVTKKALKLGIKQAKDGNRVGDIGATIQQFVESNGFNVVREFVGHGIGRQLHLQPSIPNYGKEGRGALLKKGMYIAIEPMVVMDSYEVELLRDNWTAVTKDRKYAAHFENTIYISSKGPVVLTEISN